MDCILYLQRSKNGILKKDSQDEENGSKKDESDCCSLKMSESRVNVFARLRPFSERENGLFVSVRADEAGKKVTVEDAEGAVEQALRASFDGGSSQPLKESGSKSYEFDGVFDGESSQAEVFAGVGLPVLNAVLQGYHGCVFAYGQTGSGKTFSLLNAGNSTDGHREAGLLPRLVATLFVRARMDGTHAYKVEASSFQIYNEQVDDLLHPQCKEGGGTNLGITRSATEKVGVVENLTWVGCRSANELMDLFAKARKMLIYSETKMNKASSRSHACFQIRVSRRPRTEAESVKGTAAILSVVDLAGSERVKRSGAQGAQFKEAVNINGSLLALGNVVAAMASRKKHVPYRDSKLTRLLEGRVGGNCRTTLIVCASPSADSVSETVSALTFAARAMRVETSAIINQTDDVFDADGLAVVPVSQDAEKLEAEKKKAAKDAAEALVLRQKAEADLDKERKDKELSLSKAKKEKELALLKSEQEAEARREKDMKENLKTLEEEQKVVRRLTMEVETEKKRAETLSKKLEDLEKEKEFVEKSVTVLKKDVESTKADLQKETQKRLDLESKEVVLQEEIVRKASELKESRAAVEKEKEQRKKDKEEHRREKLEADQAIVDLGKQFDLLEAEALETKQELQKAQETLDDMRKTSAQSSQQTAEELDIERKEHAAIRETIEKALQESQCQVSQLSTKVASVSRERDEAKHKLFETERHSVIDKITKAAIRNAESDVEKQKLTQETAKVTEQLEAQKSNFSAMQGRFEARVKAQNDHLALLQQETASVKTELQLKEEVFQQQLLIKTQENDKQQKAHEQLQHQLAALEERATCEIQKANASLESAASEKLKLLDKAKDLEQQMTSEAEKNANLVAEIARVREDNLKTALQYQESLKNERQRTNQVAADLETLADKFQRREPRDQDLQAIDHLRNSVHAERQRAKDLMNQAVETQRELEHARKIDRIFGPESAANRRQREIYRRGEYNNTNNLRPASANKHQRKPPSASTAACTTNKTLKLHPRNNKDNNATTFAARFQQQQPLLSPKQDATSFTTHGE